MIDDKDYSILKTISDASKPLWKKEIHERIQTHSDDLPSDPFSIQTVGRRVDSLYDQDLLQARIMSPSQAQRTLITTYQLTTDGTDAIERFRDRYLREQVCGFVNDALDEGDPTVPACLPCLFSERFGLETETIRENLSSTEILCLALTYFLQEEVDALQDLSPTIRTIQLEGQLRAPLEDYLV